MMRSKGLLPCPFCGGKAYLHKATHSSMCFVLCTGCGVTTRSYSTVEKTAAAWNMRKSEVQEE